MALESHCASCTYLGETADYEGKYYCESKGEDHYACDPKCYNWVEAYSRSDSARKNMYNNSYNHNPSSSSSSSDSSYDSPLCYLTTAMCNILGYEDNNQYLETLRKFRDETLKKDYKYLPLLLMYDVIGPQIAYELNKDPNRNSIAKMLFDDPKAGYIQKAVIAIEEKKIEDAVNIYVAMTKSLAKRYNINTNILYVSPESINPNTIDINTLGHGKSRIRRKLENI